MSDQENTVTDGKILYCSFCGKSQHEVRKLIAGPSVYICDECVELCNDIIREELDEVGAGVNRTLLNTIGDAIIRLNKERGYTFVVIEHDMDFISRLCDPVICMAEGKVLAEGTLAEIKANEQVIEAYLGTGLKNKDKLAKV